MKTLLSPNLNLTISSTRVSGALLALRVLMGVAFILHGSGKLASPFGWMGPEAPVPGLFQAFAVLAEVGGGAAIVLGLLTPLASLALIGTMLGAISFHLMSGDSFVGGWELAAVYLVISTSLLLVGPGRFSADALLAGKRAE